MDNDIMGGFTEAQCSVLESKLEELYPKNCTGFEVTSISKEQDCWQMGYVYESVVSSHPGGVVKRRMHMYFTCNLAGDQVEDFQEVK